MHGPPWLCPRRVDSKNESASATPEQQPTPPTQPRQKTTTASFQPRGLLVRILSQCCSSRITPPLWCDCSCGWVEGGAAGRKTSARDAAAAAFVLRSAPAGWSRWPRRPLLRQVGRCWLRQDCWERQSCPRAVSRCSVLVAAPRVAGLSWTPNLPGPEPQATRLPPPVGQQLVRPAATPSLPLAAAPPAAQHYSKPLSGRQRLETLVPGRGTLGRLRCLTLPPWPRGHQHQAALG